MRSIIAILCVLILCSSSCKKPSLVDYGEEVSIRNNSMSTVYYYIPELGDQFPDTLLPLVRPVLRKLLPSDYNIEFLRSSDKASYFDHLPKDTLSIFFIKDTVYSNEPWDSIRAHYHILKRMDISVTKLDSLDYEVIYQ